MIKRLQVDLEQPLRDMIVDLLQTVLEQQFGDGLGLGGFFQVSDHRYAGQIEQPEPILSA